MINPSTLDLSKLPSVALEKKSDLPNRSGIYFAIDSLGVIQYIGRTGGLKNRWYNHHRFDELIAMSGVKISYLLLDSELLESVEDALIEYFAPPLNKKRTTFAASSTGMRIVRRIVIEAPGLGERIKSARINSGRHLHFIASAAGMSAQNWYRIEREEQELSEENLRRIEEVLGVDFNVKFD